MSDRPIPPPAGEITDEWFSAVVNRMEKLFVTLDNDPIKYGPKALQGKVALLRRYLTEVQRYQIEVQKRVRLVSKRIRLAETDYSMRFNDLLANDEAVKSKPSIRDREALAASMIKADQDKIDELNRTLADLESMDKILKMKAADLKGTNSDLRLQKQLIQQELDVGGHWGEDNVNKAPNGRTLKMPDPVDERGKFIDELFDDGSAPTPGITPRTTEIPDDL